MKHLNFRDLGGIKTSDGKTVRAKRLLRSAQPVKLSADDVLIFRHYDLKFIVDLRTLHEVATTPIDAIDGVTYTHIDIMGENAAQAADPNYWMDVFSETPESVTEKFTDTYREFVTSPSSAAGYGALIKALAERAEGATLFHCAAGKDRTGFASAIILKILGVTEEEIFEDYLKTRDYQVQMREYHTNRATERGFSLAQIDAMEIVFGVQTAYLRAAFNAVNDTHGRFEKYLTDALNINADEIAQLKNNYLEN